MNNTNAGGPAFPTETFQTEGMTLRDYLAAKAMEGLIANNNINAQQLAQAAYKVADAMLEAREAA